VGSPVSEPVLPNSSLLRGNAAKTGLVRNFYTGLEDELLVALQTRPAHTATKTAQRM
jgi:hypothetical protein